MTASLLPKPLRFSRYEAIGRLASGGMATVYIARAASGIGLGQAVALKVMHPHLAEDSANVRRLIDEARIGARIHHPNVVRLLDAIAEDGGLILVLEYVHGLSLAELLALGNKHDDPPSPAIVACIIHQALLGLHGAHEARGENGEPLEVVHRDVSPHNILVSAAGTAHVADFGIARAEDRLHQTKTNNVVGKVTYMAPEQLACTGVTRRTDIYAMGVVLWEALVGEPLFGSQALRAAALAPGWAPPRPSAKNPEVSAALDAVVLRMLASDPARRMATAEAAATALASACPLAPPTEVAEWVRGLAAEPLAVLEELLQAALRSDVTLTALATSSERRGRDAPEPAPPVAKSQEQRPEPPRRRRWMAPAAILALIVSASGLAALRWPTRDRRPEPAPRVRDEPPPQLAASAPASAAAPSVSSSPAAEPAEPRPPESAGPRTSAMATPRRTPKPAPKADAGARPAGTGAATATPTVARCDPPYYVDDQGIKIFKPECMAR